MTNSPLVKYLSFLLKKRGGEGETDQEKEGEYKC